MFLSNIRGHIDLRFKLGIGETWKVAKEVIIPHFGTSVEQVQLLTWLKNVGDEVKAGDVLCEIETDKATTELESFYEGVLLKRMMEEGSEVKIGQVIAYIGEPGEEISETTANETISTKEATDGLATPEQPVEKARADKSVRAMPAARKLAKEMGVDISTIYGTGPDGTITVKDVTSILKAEVTPPEQGELIKVSKNQLSVAKRISKSYREIIPLNLVSRVNLERAISKRNQADAHGNKISFDAIVVYAISKIIKQFPQLCCYFENEQLKNVGQANIGVAISTDKDLFIPVIENADTKNIEEIDNQIRAFADKAKDNLLTVDDMSNGVFTVSNLGMFPVLSFNVIIPPQQSGAISMGTTEQLLQLTEDGIKAQTFLNLMFSVDHRFINGRQAGEFIAAFKNFVEKFL